MKSFVAVFFSLVITLSSPLGISSVSADGTDCKNLMLAKELRISNIMQSNSTSLFVPVDRDFVVTARNTGNAPLKIDIKAVKKTKVDHQLFHGRFGTYSKPCYDVKENPFKKVTLQPGETLQENWTVGREYTIVVNLASGIEEKKSFLQKIADRYTYVNPPDYKTIPGAEGYVGIYQQPSILNCK